MRINQLNEIRILANSNLHDENNRNEFIAAMEEFGQIQTEFAGNHENIIVLCAVQEDAENVLTSEDLIRKEFNSTCVLIKSIYNSLISGIKKVEPQSPNSEVRNIKLPDIELPKFSGEYKLFRTFIDRFNSLVHTNITLNAIDKYNYLVASLSGPPLTLVKSIPLTENNYENAYESLVKRYDNKRLIAISHLQAIDNAPIISFNTKSAHTLRNLVDTFNENLSALKSFALPIEEWDFLLYFLLCKHLDEETKTQFEFSSHNSKNSLPSYKLLVKFITERCDSLDAIEFSNQQSSPQKLKNSTPSKFNSKFKQSSSFFIQSNANMLCNFCKSDHSIYKCQSFREISVPDRINFARKNKLCLNCLSSGHLLKDCNSKSTCRICQSRHHSFLHFSNKYLSQKSDPVNTDLNANENSLRLEEKPTTSEVVFNGMVSSKGNVVLLSTAIIDILDNRGHYQKIRVLLDSGSQANFITQKCLNKLGLKIYPLSMSVKGLGKMQDVMCNGGVNCTLKPVGKLFPIHTIDAVVIPKLCSDIPRSQPNRQFWPHLKNIELSDPHFTVPGQVDMLLGAELFPHVLEPGRIVGGINEPVALNTIFGWVVMGKTLASQSPTVTNYFVSIDDQVSNIEKTLRRFWEIEEISNATPSLTAAEKLCEEIYENTTKRDKSGRYIVKLPFRDTEPEFDINDSRIIALRRFHSLENRLLKNITLYEGYKKFMQDYLDSGHMSEIKNFSQTQNAYYIPHHCVFKPDSTSTKLRVVFDASCKTSSGKSLNDTLLIGPKLQNDIFDILLNFRVHKIAFTADIKQMFRQILVQESHKDFQRILWRFSPTESLKEFRLNTVTFGLSCSPFLANRTILQLARDEANPKLLPILEKNIYVDDLVVSCENLSEAILIQQQLIALFNKGGFELRKWASNNREFLSNISEDKLHINSCSFDNDGGLKVLGLKWQPLSDNFSYSVLQLNEQCTKRSILSDIARIFDPLGFLTPITLYAKVLMQHMWTLGIDWDEKPPADVCRTWLQFKSELSELSEMSIPRCILSNSSDIFELHGFCDASEKGYACVIYFRKFIGNAYNVSLVSAKAKIAPLKRISIPRMELCAACLLSDLYAAVCSALGNNVKISNSYFWSDSTTVLHWIRSSPHKWKTFVSNRVSKIQNQISPSLWYYIKSSENPADCASRGILPSQVLNHSLWWAGPYWLQLGKEHWPNTSFAPNDHVSETSTEARNLVLTICINQHIIDTLLENCSTLIKVQNILVFVFRFINNCQKPQSLKLGFITNEELTETLFYLIKHVQETHFGEELNRIQRNQLPSKYLRKLNIFLDQKKLIRVGGRLTYSKLSYSQKHPILIPKISRLTELIISHYHNKYFHPGNQTLHYLLIQQFWILSAKQVIKKITSKCKKCWNVRPKPYQPPMGNLPEMRISKLKPFSCVGVDFAGPINTTLAKIRGAKTRKSYICVFVCFVTKAIHLELSSELSTDAFLAAFRRFIARRGRCSKIYSDCGSNFLGANRQIKEIFNLISAKENISWHFNPPGAPHFSGLAEAGVKSVKTHLLRVIGLQTLTFEELSTVLCQIESLLNSRPLCALSSDPNDLSVLSPGHFLTLEPLSCLPEPDLSEISLNRLSRWQMLQRMQQDFWNRWQNEYLHTLQQREKWLDPTSEKVIVGKLVLIKNELLPPLKWNLGRIIQVHPGKDGVVRVATVKTAQGTLKRPLVKLCPLPNDSE